MKFKKPDTTERNCYNRRAKDKPKIVQNAKKTNREKDIIGGVFMTAEINTA